MKPAAFEFVRAHSVADAVMALDHDDAKIIAGGQSLVPMMNFRLAQPARLVDINAIADLHLISETADQVIIGSLVTHTQALRSAELMRHFPVIADAMEHVAHLAIRNRGTIGGSLAHADPSAEWPLLTVLLDADLVINGPGNERICDAADFFVAPLVTDLAETELLTAVRLPKPTSGAGMGFDEVSRRAGDFAMVAAGALVRVEQGVFSEVRIALGGVADIPVRAVACETALLGAPAEAASIKAIAELACDDLEPETDIHCSAGYRLHLVPVLVRKVVARALERALANGSGTR